MNLKDIVSLISEWAPPGIAQSYDNVGLQLGDPNQQIASALVAMELTPAVIDEAEDLGADLIVTHHPLFFRPLTSLSPSTLVGSMALRLAKLGIAVVSAHTNLDSVVDGVSHALAQQLGLNNPEILSPVTGGMLKLVTFVPTDSVDVVRNAVGSAGAGRVARYSDVASLTKSVGVFRPLHGAKPAVGHVGNVEEVPEWRLEVSLTRDVLPAVLEALSNAHPYETPLYDVYEAVDTSSGFGLGMIGALDESMTLESFLGLICRRLDIEAVRFAGNLSDEIQTVAVCGGAGRDLVGAALRNGANAYVTSDVGYHTFFEVLDGSGHPRMALIDAGHYETEAGAEQLIVDRLSAVAPTVSWIKTTIRTSPISTFVRP